MQLQSKKGHKFMDAFKTQLFTDQTLLWESKNSYVASF